MYVQEHFSFNYYFLFNFCHTRIPMHLSALNTPLSFWFSVHRPFLLLNFYAHTDDEEYETESTTVLANSSFIDFVV
jgi:hypothetical protein